MPPREIRACNVCGEEWEDNGNPICANCGSDDTEIEEVEEEDGD